MVEGTDIKRILGQALREIRLRKNISQEKLAELANLDRSYISELENGNKTASVATLFKLSIALEINPSAFMKEVETKFNEEGIPLMK